MLIGLYNPPPIIRPRLNFQCEAEKNPHKGELLCIYFWQAYRNQNYGAISLIRHIQEKQQFRLDSE